MRLKDLLQNFRTVPRRHYRVFFRIGDLPARAANGTGIFERSNVCRLRLVAEQRRVHPAVIMPLEFQDQRPIGIGAGKPVNNCTASLPLDVNATRSAHGTIC